MTGPINIVNLPMEFTRLINSDAYQKSNKRCMILGNFGENHNGERLAIALERLGWFVCRVCWYSMINNHKVDVDFCLSSFLDYKEFVEYRDHVKSFDLKKLLDLFESKFEFILLMQHSVTYKIDKSIDTFIHYYYTEILHPYLPANVNTLIYAFPGGDQCVARSFPSEYISLMEKVYLPHAVDLDIFRPKEETSNLTEVDRWKEWDKRKYLFAFKGVPNFPKIGDYLQDNLYNLRDTFLPVCQKLGLYYPDPSKVIWTDDYIDFMQNTKIALNIPGLYGGINQRMFEACASKCILLNYHVDGMEEIGFVDNKTCYTFKTEEELVNKYNHIINNLDEAKQVAQNGYEMVNANHGYIQRAMMFLLIHFIVKTRYVNK